MGYVRINRDIIFSPDNKDLAEEMYELQKNDHHKVDLIINSDREYVVNTFDEYTTKEID